jgi:hypothetical protein
MPSQEVIFFGALAVIWHPRTHLGRSNKNSFFKRRRVLQLLLKMLLVKVVKIAFSPATRNLHRPGLKQCLESDAGRNVKVIISRVKLQAEMPETHIHLITTYTTYSIDRSSTYVLLQEG